MQEKPKWEKPECTVLQRRRPEETVLSVCKHSAGGGDSYTNGGCYSLDAPWCKSCESMGGS